MKLVATLILASLSTGSCSDEGGDCACSEPQAAVFVHLDEPPAGGEIEMCFRDEFASATIHGGPPVDGGFETAVAYDTLAGWTADAANPLTFTVRDVAGRTMVEATAQPDVQDSCCGEYLRIEL